METVEERKRYRWEQVLEDLKPQPEPEEVAEPVVEGESTRLLRLKLAEPLPMEEVEPEVMTEPEAEVEAAEPEVEAEPGLVVETDEEEIETEPEIVEAEPEQEPEVVAEETEIVAEEAEDKPEAEEPQIEVVAVGGMVVEVKPEAEPETKLYELTATQVEMLKRAAPDEVEVTKPESTEA